MHSAHDANRDSRQRKHRQALIVLAVVIGVPALLYGIYSLTLGRSPLAGPTAHDFGVVIIDGASATAEHTFTLTNRTRQPIRLTGVRTSCGCTAGSLSTDLVEPGEAVSITASLSLTRAGRRTEELSILMADRGVRRLKVSALGRPREELHMRRMDDTVLLSPRQQFMVGFTADIWPDVWDDVNDVPAPQVRAPEGVRATVASWSMSEQPRGENPARWSGRVALELLADELPDDAELVITLREGQELRFDLRTTSALIPRMLTEPPADPSP
jgi:hypothetical protein